MTITVTRDRTRKMKHVAQVRAHALPIDEPPANGGEDAEAYFDKTGTELSFQTKRDGAACDAIPILPCAIIC